MLQKTSFSCWLAASYLTILKFKFNSNQYKTTIGPGGEMVITKVCGTLVFGSIPSQGTKK